MTKQICLLVLLVGFVGLSQQNDSDSLWIQDFELAKQKAKEENKSILMYFTGSDWCKPCKMLKVDVFDSWKFKKYEKSYVFLKIDIPRNRDLLTEEQMKINFSLLNQYNKEKSFPLLIALSAKGKVLDDISGYSSLRDPTYHYEFLNKFSK